MRVKGQEQKPPREYLLRSANVVIGGAALLGLGIVLYAIYTYAWTQERHFANLAGPLFYYVFPGLLVFVALGGGGFPLNLARYWQCALWEWHVGHWFLSFVWR